MDNQSESDIDEIELQRKALIKEKRCQRLVIARDKADQLRRELRNETEPVVKEPKIKIVKEKKLTKIEQKIKNIKDAKDTVIEDVKEEVVVEKEVEVVENGKEDVVEKVKEVKDEVKEIEIEPIFIKKKFIKIDGLYYF